MNVAPRASTMSRCEATSTTSGPPSSNARTCSSRQVGRRRSSPHTSFTSSPVASSVTRFQFRRAPPPASVRTRVTRGSDAYRWRSSQVPSVEEWSETTSSKSVNVCARIESIVSSMNAALS
ncbi:Uncharacterised protein [Mycobacteroides abscessus]|nr:Uncharacterised protein [Mycobacteroides abscessus]